MRKRRSEKEKEKTEKEKEKKGDYIKTRDRHSERQTHSEKKK